MGVKDDIYSNRLTRLSDCPKIGDVIGDGIVTTVSLKIDSP